MATAITNDRTQIVSNAVWRTTRAGEGGTQVLENRDIRHLAGLAPSQL